MLSLNNTRFGDYLHHIYPPELEIKDTTESTSYLDIQLEYDPVGVLHTRIYDKRNDFDFSIVNFPHMDSNIPAAPTYGVFVSQLVRYARACSSCEDFIARTKLLITRLIDQGYSSSKLKCMFKKFYG